MYTEKQAKILAGFALIAMMIIGAVAAYRLDEMRTSMIFEKGYTMKVLKVTKSASFGGTLLIGPESFDAAKAEFESMLDTLVVGDTLEIEVIEMTREEIDALPEFQGW